MLSYLQRLDDFIAMLVLELDHAAASDRASPFDEKLDACKISLVYAETHCNCLLERCD